MSEQEALHPWQIFSGLFIGFWATSAYFDHFLMTLVFCIVFGVVGDIVTKEMYGGKKANTKDKQKSMSDELSIKEKLANNERIWQKAEAALEANEEDDDVPPPLPVKDYESSSLDTLSAKLQALADASADTEDENDSNTNEASREFNRTISDEHNQNTSFLNSNLINQVTIEEDVDEQPDGLGEEKKFYAPDSSDDEDDDEDYASREVNFDDSDSEEEDFDEFVRNPSVENISKLSDKEGKEANSNNAKEE